MATGTISRSLRLLAASALFGSVQALNVTVSGRQILVDGAPWFSKGICYSPTPTGSDASLDAPYGDYQIDEYEWMWERDFALMKAMGANTIRTYAWNVTYNHTKFLDRAHENGLMVLVTFYMGTTRTRPFYKKPFTDAINDFVGEVKKYLDHPAILMWGFGNELNLPGNGFWGDIGASWPSFVKWVDGACEQAAEAQSNAGVVPRPCTTMLSDGNPATSWGPQDSVAKSLNVWSVQLYRGKSFIASYMNGYKSLSSKPILVTEYGVDAYNDPCGTEAAGSVHVEGSAKICINTVNDSSMVTVPSTNGCPWGECPGVHADWVGNISADLLSQSALTGGVSSGGFSFEWSDEFWKNRLQKGCPAAAGLPNFTWAGCVDQSHYDCQSPKDGEPTFPLLDINTNRICGYVLAGVYDKFQNEGWWGITKPRACGQNNKGENVDLIEPRDAYYRLQKLWKGTESRFTPDCKDLCKTSIVPSWLGGICGTVPTPAPTPAPTPSNSTPSTPTPSTPTPGTSPPSNSTPSTPTPSNSTPTLQPSTSAPAAASGGVSTVLIVLLVIGGLGLVAGGCFMFAKRNAKTVRDFDVDARYSRVGN